MFFFSPCCHDPTKLKLLTWDASIVCSHEQNNPGVQVFLVARSKIMVGHRHKQINSLFLGTITSRIVILFQKLESWVNKMLFFGVCFFLYFQELLVIFLQLDVSINAFGCGFKYRKSDETKNKKIGKVEAQQ